MEFKPVFLSLVNEQLNIDQHSSSLPLTDNRSLKRPAEGEAGVSEDDDEDEDDVHSGDENKQNNPHHK